MAVRPAPIRKADDATLVRWVGDCGAALTRPVPGAGLVELARELAWVAEFLAAVRSERARREPVAAPPAGRGPPGSAVGGADTGSGRGCCFSARNGDAVGMFDWLKCAHPLPGDPPAFVRDSGHLFQTKGLGCTMGTYEITADGRLAPDESPGGFHGDLAFYDTNIVAAGYGVAFTRDGEDAVSVDYRARFDRGRLAEVVEVNRVRSPALPVARFTTGHTRPSPDEIAREKARAAEDLVGRMLYLLWGGREPDQGESVEVVAAGPHEWAVRRPDGHLEVIDRRFRDAVLFDSRDDARRAADAARERSNRVRAGYEAALSNKGD